MSTNLFPKQRMSYKKKIANDYKWCKDMMDFLIMHSAAPQQWEVVGNVNTEDWNEYDRMLANYQLYNNQVNQADFDRECNPLGIEVGQWKDQVQPYNKTYNKIQVLLGEEMKRPFNFRAVLVNSEGIQSKLNARNELLREFVNAQVQFEADRIKAKFDPNANPEEVEQQIQSEMETIMPPEEVDKYMRTTYREAREVLTNKILQYLIKKESIMEKKNDAFKHGLISGVEMVWVGVENNNPVVNIVNSIGQFHHKSPDVKYVQDGLYAGVRTMMTTGDILDKFGEFMTENDIKKIEGDTAAIGGAREDMAQKKMVYSNSNKDPYQEWERALAHGVTTEGQYGKSWRHHDWVVTHVEWKSQKKVGFLTYMNDKDIEETILVSEDFNVPPHAEKVTTRGQYNKKIIKWTWDDFTLEWKWIPEVWTGVRIGEDIYCCMGPKPYQYRSVDNPYDVKLGYHGVIYNNTNADPVSLMDRMKPFQYLYFILVHKLKRLIARDKGQVFQFDISMVPESLGLEKTMYYLEEMDINFYNPLQNAELPGAMHRGAPQGSVQRSNMQHILNYVQLMQAIDDQISDVAGITRQREGQGSPTETATVSQQSIIQSTHITEAVYFAPHEKNWEQILSSLVQCAQSAWKDKSVIKQFVLDDLSLETLNITDTSFFNSDFGVFVSSGAKESTVFQRMQDLAQPLLQNDKAKFSDIIKLMRSDSITELEKQIEQSEKDFEERQAQEMQAQQEQLQQQIQAQKEMQEDQQAHEKELKEMELENKILLAQIDSFKFQQDQDSNDNGVPDQLEVAKFQADVALKNRKMDLDEKKMKQDAKQKEEELKIKKKQANKPNSTSK